MGVLLTGISNRRGVDNWRKLRHMLQAEPVEHRRILFFERRQVYVFFNVLILRSKLSKASHRMNGVVQSRRRQAVFGFWGRCIHGLLISHGHRRHRRSERTLRRHFKFLNTIGPIGGKNYSHDYRKRVLEKAWGHGLKQVSGKMNVTYMSTNIYRTSQCLPLGM